MKMFNKFQSPLGYQVTDNLIDTYGVDHSNFSARDEVAYQAARQAKEDQLIKNFNNQGISDNYPQYGTNFWGNPDNNYGFGSSNIHDNIENRENQTEKSYRFGNNNQNQSVWNKNQYQTPTPWAKQSTSLGRNQPVQTKPVYENPNPRRYSTEEILWDGVKGFEQGALGGLERGINSATYGLYDFVSDLADNGGYERRQKELENSANQVGLGKPYKYLNYLIDYAASGLTTSGGYNIANKALKGYKFM